MLNSGKFIGCGSNYKDSRVVLFGAPFDGTTSYRAGTRAASRAIRTESFGIETYSPYQDKDLSGIKVHDAGDLDLPFGNTKRVLGKIKSYVKKIIKNSKIPLMLGGEHLVTLGAVEALAEKYPDLYIIHLDAHADLRENYIGEKLSHSTVMRRIWDIVGDNHIYQFGIRSGEKTEFDFADKHTKMTRFDIIGFEKIIKEIKDNPVYFTLDLDVLDPGEFPGTGTPEAGGISWKELMGVILSLSGLNIAGADICELAPSIDPTGISTALACKTLREILLAI